MNIVLNIYYVLPLLGTIQGMMLGANNMIPSSAANLIDITNPNMDLIRSDPYDFDSSTPATPVSQIFSVYIRYSDNDTLKITNSDGKMNFMDIENRPTSGIEVRAMVNIANINMNMQWHTCTIECKGKFTLDGKIEPEFRCYSFNKLMHKSWAEAIKSNNPNSIMVYVAKMQKSPKNNTDADELISAISTITEDGNTIFLNANLVLKSITATLTANDVYITTGKSAEISAYTMFFTGPKGQEFKLSQQQFNVICKLKDASGTTAEEKELPKAQKPTGPVIHVADDGKSDTDMFGKLKNQIPIPTM